MTFATKIALIPSFYFSSLHGENLFSKVTPVFVCSLKRTRYNINKNDRIKFNDIKSAVSILQNEQSLHLIPCNQNYVWKKIVLWCVKKAPKKVSVLVALIKMD